MKNTSSGYSSFTIRHEEKPTSRDWMRSKRAKEFEFIGVDGEGTGDGDNHKYVLLGVGDIQFENPDGITWKEAFEFLYSEYEKHPNAAFVGFFLGYDFSQILKSLPEDRARILLTREGINARRRRRSGKNNKPFPVRYMGWEFDMLPGRRLQLRPLICDCDERHTKCPHHRPGWLYICDAGPYWQTSLLNVLNPEKWKEPIVSAEEFQILKSGKENRSQAKLDDDMRFYNRLENRVFARAMGRLREGFLEIGVNLSRSQWFGPGQAAAEWMRKEGIPKREVIENAVPEQFLSACSRSYIGGWFEIFGHGIIQGTSYEYDLNSAYPHIIRNLPCLLHGRYSNGTGGPPRYCYKMGSSTLVYARVHSKDNYIGSALNRSRSGTIRRPRTSEGWYWLHEIVAGGAADVIDPDSVEFREWICYEACDCPSPCRNVANLYDKRLEVGKDTLLGKAAKLVYNSMYGKFAQSIGVAPFGNWVYASLITAGCRVAILNAIATHPRGTAAVLMVATDGVYFSSHHPGLPISEKLGEWGEAEKENLTLFKPGVYWDDKARLAIASGRSASFKARGVNARDFAKQIGNIDAKFRALLPDSIPESRIILKSDAKYTSYAERRWPNITFGVNFSMTSALTALSVRKWESAGHISQNVQLTHSSDPCDKRGRAYLTKGGMIRTEVLELTENEIPSIPYEKKFGLEDPFSRDRLELLGDHPDGMVADVLNELRRELTGE